MKVTKTLKVGEVERTISVEAQIDEMYQQGVITIRSTEDYLDRLAEWIDEQLQKEI